jgi:hypothetical protein
MKNYYGLLGLDYNATTAEIKAAYRHLASKYHPDKLSTLGAEAQAQGAARMTELNEAVAVLSDRSRRAKYDQSWVPTVNRDPDTQFHQPETLGGPGPARVGSPEGAPSGKLYGSSRGLSIKERLQARGPESRGPRLEWHELSLWGWEWGLQARNDKRSLLVAYCLIEDMGIYSIRHLEGLLEVLLQEPRMAMPLVSVIALVGCGRLVDSKAVVQRLQTFLLHPRMRLRKVEPVLVLYDGGRRRAVLFGVVPDDPDVEGILRLVLSSPSRRVVETL